MGAPAPAAATVGQAVGRYVLFDEIASGGMASVHFGRMRGSVGFARSVAVKRLHRHLASDPDFVAMFLDEARLAARIHHSNVVDTLDVVTIGSELILVMEYVHGESLSMLLRAIRRAGGVVPPPIAASVLSGVLHGLHAAHEATSEQGEPLGIVHRDMSPQNVIVGADGIARVLDFGVAKALTRTQTTREGQLKGKLAYMAPEQLRRGVVDRRADIYAASVVLWETLTAERMHDADDEAGLVMSIIEGKAEPPSSRVADIPFELDTVVMRGLDVDSSKRYPTALEMADALENAIAPARPREVAEWVAKNAPAALAKRADRLAAIERIDLDASSPRLLTDVPLDPRLHGEPLPMPAGDEQSRVTAVHTPSQNASVTAVLPPQAPGSTPALPALPALHATATKPKSPGATLFVIGGLLVLLLLASGGWAARKAILARRATPAAGPGALASEATSPGQPGIAIAPLPPVTAADDPEPAASAAPSAVASGSAAAKPFAKRPPAHGRRPAVDECDPPFVIDEQGVKRFKKRCL
jgi:serine/threonine protein kinase